MYERILVPTDGSPGTSRVLTHALELAERVGATLHGLYVLDARNRGLEGGMDALRESLRSEGERATERVRARAEDAGVDVTAAIREGVPHEEILAYVEAEGIDAVVMGTHGRSGVDRVLLGSVTERVVRLSPVPVLTVGLSPAEPEVEEAAEARAIASDALAREGHEDPEVTDVYRETGTWVVGAAAGDERYNIHVDAATGEAVVAELPA
ncbi:MAG: universal stress protein [Halobacteriales archaeon]